MGEKISSIIPNVAAMKKAGLSPAVTAMILILTIPGSWEFFFNKAGEDAQQQASVAYEVLANEVKHLREDDEMQREELQQLRDAVLKMYGMCMESREATIEMAEAMPRKVLRRKARKKVQALPKPVPEPDVMRKLRVTPATPSTLSDKRSLPRELDALVQQKAGGGI